MPLHSACAGLTPRLKNIFDRCTDPKHKHMKPAVWAARIMSKYINMDKAANRYKLAFGIGVGLWVVQVGIALTGFVDTGSSFLALQSADTASPDEIRDQQYKLAVKAALYTSAVMALRLVRFTALGYGMAGFTHKRVQDGNPTPPSVS